MHRPVGAAGLAELPGAVERVDDPHPLGVEAAAVLGALLGQHAVVGPRPREASTRKWWAAHVAVVAQRPLGRGAPAVPPAARRAAALAGRVARSWSAAVTVVGALGERGAAAGQRIETSVGLFT